MRCRRRASRAVHLVTLAVALTLAGRGANAHEAGTTTVTATLEPSHFVIEIVCDYASVVARLDAAAGRPRAPWLTIDEYQNRLTALENELVRHVDVRFDGVSVRAAVDAIAPADDPAFGAQDDMLASPRVAIRLTAPVPDGARSFSWSYGLTFVSYAFIVKEAGSGVGRMEWLDGDQASQPFALNGTPPLRLSAMPFAVVLLVVSGLLLARRDRRTFLPVRSSY